MPATYYPSDSFLRDPEGRVQIFTSGCCLNDNTLSAAGGIGVYFNDQHTWNVSAPARGRPPTSSTAEYEAVTEALSIATKNRLPRIRVLLDSTVVFGCLSEWRKQCQDCCCGWLNARGPSTPCRTQVIEMDKAENQYLCIGGNVTYQLVAADGVCRDSSEAYELAKAGALQYKSHYQNHY